MTWNCRVAIQLERERSSAWELVQSVDTTYGKIERFKEDVTADRWLFTIEEELSVHYASDAISPIFDKLKFELLDSLDKRITLYDCCGNKVNRPDGRSITEHMLDFSRRKKLKDAYDLGFAIKVANKDQEMEPLSLEEIEMLSRFLDGVK